MKIRLASLGLALASLASVPALADDLGSGFNRPVIPTTVAYPTAHPATTVAYPGPRPAYTRPAVRPEQVQVARLRGRVNEIERDLRAGVMRGRVHAQALGALHQQKAQLERAIQMATRDGVVGPFEARRLDAMVDAMARLERDYRVRVRGGRY